MTRWHEKIKYIPGIALSWIVDQIENLENLPRNIPKLFKRQWFLYQKAHPEKTIFLEEQCEKCHGGGILFFRKIETMYNPPMPVEYVCICGSCNNSRRKFGSFIEHGGIIKQTGVYVAPTLRLTREEIESQGWEFLPTENKYAPKIEGKLPKVDLEEIPRKPTKYNGPRPEGVYYA